MTVLVVGATGDTGRPLVEQLLAKNHQVRVIVRSPHKLSAEVLENPNLTVIEASILDLTDDEMTEHVAGCDAVVSCLGHVINFKGMFGSPRKLCKDAARRLCNAIERNAAPTAVKFILMNTVAIQNSDIGEKKKWFERLVLGFMRIALPPHNDNVVAANHLRRNVGRESKYVEWSTVRPDSLIDAEVSPYEILESPVPGVFATRPTARANVAHFMVELIENEELWNEWKFRMPVIINNRSSD